MTKCICYTLFICTFLFAQNYNTNLNIMNNYNQWGWDSVYVVDNGLIKTSIFPIVGARVLEYNLNDHVSMFVNPARLGFVSEDGDPYAFPGGGIGGYKVWPSPQADWEGAQWPPPPILAWGPYSSEVLSDNADSVTLFFNSMEETSRTPGIRFERQYTFYKNSSHVKVKQVIINENSESKTWGIWDNTQSIVHHQDESDYENFWVYFPKNPDSRYGKDGYTFRSSDHPTDGWHGEVAPGIIGAHYEPADVKLFGDPHKGWICYVDEQDGYAYAKTFPLFEEATYPDDGARVAIYFNGNPQYMEVEITGPVVDLAANGGSASFTVDWWAAKINGPILTVNSIGAIAQYAKLENNVISGRYGIFHTGTAQLVFLNKNGDILKSGPQYSVSPLETFNLNDSTALPSGTAKIKVCVLNPAQELIGVLDSLMVNVDGMDNQKRSGLRKLGLYQNFPNPFNPDTRIEYTLNQNGPVRLSIYNALGQLQKTLLNQIMPAGRYFSVWDGKNTRGKDVSSGIYFYTLESGDYKLQRKMLLLR